MDDITQKLKERAVELAKPMQGIVVMGQAFDGLGFLLSGEQYFIDEMYVNEVLPLMELTPLPCTPSFILGIINVRGRILSVVNLKDFLNLPARGITNLNRVIVVKKNEIEIGLLVDEVTNNVELDLKEVQQNYEAITDEQRKYIVGVTRNQDIVFDIAKFLSDQEIIINENS